MDLVLLTLVVISIVVSLFAIYAGNTKFIGILGIALFALFLISWRIFSLRRSPVSGHEPVDIDFDLLGHIRPPEK